MDVSGFDKYLSEKLNASDRVQERVARASQKIKNNFNPLNMENVEHVDGDTFAFKDSGRRFRVTNQPSFGVDTFESDRRIYENDPQRLANHRRNYSKLTGRPEWSITINELVERGMLQSEQTRARMEALGNEGRLGFKTTGVDAYGRELLELYDTQTGQNFYANHSGREQNASYDSKYNAGQQLQDIFTGERGRHEAFQGSRGVKKSLKDAGTSLAVGTGRMLSGLAQGSLTLLGEEGPAVDRFFNTVNHNLDRFHNYALSNEALARNARIDRNRARTVELFNYRKQQYLDQGYSDKEAAFYAGAEEFQDTVADLIFEPGYIIDKTIESLPYMIGVASAGRAAVTQATRLLSKRALKEVTKAGGTKAQAVQSLDRYRGSKEFKDAVSRVASTTGVGTVGITEALTNSADVYNSVLNMSEEEAMKSENYRALRAEGAEHVEATRVLAKSAFESTFIPGLLLASAAALVTGAGGFEARLFTRRAGLSAVERASTGAATAATGGGITRRAGRQAGRFARFAGTAGVSEATEEAIQSGGGEFLSQLARFEAGVGEAPGPGVGAAAGEGAAIGFVSGAGAQTVIGGAKKLADSDIRSSGLDRVREIKETRNIIGKGGIPGGSTAAAASTVRNFKDVAKAEAEFNTLMEKYGADDVKDMDEAARSYKHIRQIAEQVKRDKGALTAEQTKILEDVRQVYVKSVDRVAKGIIEKNEDLSQLSDREKAILDAAIEEDAPAVRSLKGEDSQLGRLYQSVRDGIDTIETLHQEALTRAGESSADGTVTTRNGKEVEEQKMGRLDTPGYGPGLRLHFDLIKEAIVQNKPKLVRERGAKFANFLNSQAKKIATLKKLIDSNPQEGDREGTFVYKPGSTEALYNKLVKEHQQMVKVRNHLADLYREYAGGKPATELPTPQPSPDEIQIVGRVPGTEQESENLAPQGAETTQETAPAEEEEVRVVGNINDEAAPDTEEVRIVGNVFDEGTQNDQEQEPAQSANQQPEGSESGTGAAAPAQPAAGTQGEPEPAAAEGTTETPETQSEGSESRAAQSSARLKKIAERLRALAARRAARAANVADFDPDAPIELNEGQQAAYDAVTKWLRKTNTTGTYAITGSAGTGKTTVINTILADVADIFPNHKVILSSPTHRANSVLEGKNPDRTIKTLHSLLGLKPHVQLDKFNADDLKFKRGFNYEPMEYGSLLIVDEASMINDMLFGLLMDEASAQGARVVFLGDLAQLQPVKQKHLSKALTATDGASDLEQVMRAKNAALLDESIDLRERGDFTYVTNMDKDDNGVRFINNRGAWLDKAISFFKSPEFKKNPLMVRLVANTNVAAEKLNKEIRERLYGPKPPPYVVGEILMGYNAITDNEGMRNGLDYIVEKVSEPRISRVWNTNVEVIDLQLRQLISGKPTHVSVVNPQLPANQKRELINNANEALRTALRRGTYGQFKEEQNTYVLPFKIPNHKGKGWTIDKKTIDYGYAHTIHKSQGGTYRYVMVDSNNIDNNRMSSAKDKAQLRYVGLTRAEEGAFIFTERETFSFDVLQDGPTNEETPETEIPPTTDEGGTTEDAAAKKAAETPAPKTELERVERDIKTVQDRLEKVGAEIGQLQSLVGEGIVEMDQRYEDLNKEQIRFENQLSVLIEERNKLQEQQRDPNYQESINVWYGAREAQQLSNLSLRPFSWEGKDYYSVEHAYQTLKSGKFDTDVYEDERWKNAGTKVQGKKGTLTKESWNLGLMKDLVQASFNQNPEAAKALVATGTRPFTHKGPRPDRIWEKAFPQILSEVREALRHRVINETNGGAQAQAQPERSAEPEVELEERGQEGTPLTRAQRATNDIYWDALDEIDRLQKGLKDGTISEDNVRFTRFGNAYSNTAWTNRLEILMANGISAEAALAQLQGLINENIRKDVPRTSVSAKTIPVDDAVQTALELAEKRRSKAPKGLVTKEAASFLNETNYPRIRSWILGAWDNTQAKIAQIRRQFGAILMPPSLKEGFERASSTTRSIIAAVPNLHEILENKTAREKFYEGLNLTPQEEEAFEAFRSFRQEFAKALGQSYNKLSTAQKIDFAAKEGRRYQNWIKDNPAYLFTDINDNMDPVVVTAMAYEAMNWLTGDGRKISNDDSAIRRILGIPVGETPTARQQRLASAGTLRRNVVRSLGDNIWRHLNMRAKSGNPDVDFNLEERMKAALGTLAVRAMIVQKRAEPVAFTAEDYLSMQGSEQTIFEGSVGEVSFLRIASRGKRGKRLYEHTRVNEQLNDAVNPARSKLDQLFGVSSITKQPLKEPPTTEHIPVRALRSLTRLSKSMREAIANMQSEAWTANTDMFDMLKRFDRTEYLRAAHEYQTNMSIVHDEELDAVEGRNAAYERFFDEAMKWYDQNGTDNFWLTYFMSRTGRVHVGSNTINPQSNKLHRFVFNMKAWEETVSLNDQEMLNNFKLAVALGMDYKVGGKGVDKLTIQDALANFDEYMAQDDIQSALLQLAQPGTEQINLYNANGEPTALAKVLANEGTHTLAALMAWQSYQTALETGAESFTTSLPMEVDGITNGFSAGILQTPPPNAAYAETIKDLLRATGVMFSGDVETSFAQWVKDPSHLDNYQQAAALTADALRDLMTNLDDPTNARAITEIVQQNFGPMESDLRDLQAGRKFAKNPLMIVAYGAGIASIQRNMVNQMVEAMYRELAETNLLQDGSPDASAKQAEAVLNILNRAVKVMNVAQAESFRKRDKKLWDSAIKKPYTLEDLRNIIRKGKMKDRDGNPVKDIQGLARNFRFGQPYDKDYNPRIKGRGVDWDMRNFANGLNMSYGASLESALDQMLDGLKEARNTYNHTILVMNAIYEAEFNRRVDVEERFRNRKIGNAARREIQEQMMREGFVPSIATPYSESLDENLELTAYNESLLDERVEIAHPRLSGLSRRFFEAKDRFSKDKQDTVSTATSLTARTPSTNVGVAGVVGTIHSLDGTNSADVFGRFSVLNIFDAWAMALSMINRVTEYGNKRYYQQHRDYDMGQELTKSMDRMLGLLNPAENRLSPQQIFAVGQAVEAGLRAAQQFTEEMELVTYGKKGDPDYEALINFLTADQRSKANAATEAKKALFEGMQSSGQFAHETASYRLTQEDKETPVAPVEQPQDYVQHKAAREKIEKKAQTLAKNNTDRGNLIKAVAKWIRDDGPRHTEALRVIARTYQLLGNETLSDHVNDLVAVLHNHLDDSKPIETGRIPGTDYDNAGLLDLAGYNPATNQILVDPKAMKAAAARGYTVDGLSSILHEIVHAATVNTIFEIQRTKPDLFNQLHEQAVTWAEKVINNRSSTRLQGSSASAIVEAALPYVRVAEYIAYTLTDTNADTSPLSLLFENGTTVANAFRATGQIITQGNIKNPVIRSSQDKVNNQLFHEVPKQKLIHEKVAENLEAMEALDANTDVGSATEYRNFIGPVMDAILIPGLASLTQDIFLQVGVETDGTKNIGEVERGSDGDILKVQAAGRKLASNADMSNQEVFAHELYHAITGYALTQDTAVRAELRKIYDSVANQITWQDFMPADDEIAGDRTAAEHTAQQMYNYIFGTPTRDVDQLQEFAAFALSNQAFALKLTQLETPSATEPLWTGNVLSFLVNLVSRGLEAIRGYKLGTRKASNAYDAMFKLSQRIVTINNQAAARKYMKAGHDGYWRNTADQATANFLNEKIDRIEKRLREKELLARENGKTANLVRKATIAALRARTDDQQVTYNEFARELGVNKSNALAEIFSEVLPYNKDDRGQGERIGFLDLVRKSKVEIDIARQRAIEHTKQVLNGSFDPKRTLTKAQRLAMTNVLLRTDLVSLLSNNEDMLLEEVVAMLNTPGLLQARKAQLETQLEAEMNSQGHPELFTMYQRQLKSLANYMNTGVMTEYNGMKNAHNIANQFNLLNFEDRVSNLQNMDEIISMIDQLATLNAVEQVNPRDLDNALKVINHEMSRTDDNGIVFLMGMADNFKRSAQNDLFGGNPVQMRKGYVYDITDGDINIEVIVDTPENRERMENLGMELIGEVQRDRNDQTTNSRRLMYRGYRGVNTWQKAAVSLTGRQGQGVDLFEISGFDPQQTAWSLGQMKGLTNAQAKKQFKNGAVPAEEVIAIPVLNSQGSIVNYRYEMSLENKQKYLKNGRNNDYFDQVIPRQFGSIQDRVATVDINNQVAALIYEEWERFKDDPKYNLVNIGKHGNKRSKDMWNVIPREMKDSLQQAFQGTEFVDGKKRLVAFPLRDEAVNLVLGFRKLSILDLPAPGGKKLIRGKNATFAAKTAEKIWQEMMKLVRIKMAIINPQVVIGNLSSNFAILLAKGIPVEYIKAKTPEAIRSMRQYQRDVQRIDELQRLIGVRQLEKKNTSKLKLERDRLIEELSRNPVRDLVQSGLFTSIVEEQTEDEDTYREWVVSSLLEKTTGAIPKGAVKVAKEAHMLPGTTAFNMAIAATQYGDFIGRYVMFKYQTEVQKMDRKESINQALAHFIYYDMPQNRWLQFANDNGFFMFSKFFLRIQPVVAQLFASNPVKATAVIAMQQALMPGPTDENIGTFALFNNWDNRIHLFPGKHVEHLNPLDPSLFQWFGMLGL
jgi:exodeoxyribonuclease-5